MCDDTHPLRDVSRTRSGGFAPADPFRCRSRGPAIPAPLRRARPWRATLANDDCELTLRRSAGSASGGGTAQISRRTRRRVNAHVRRWRNELYVHQRRIRSRKEKDRRVCRQQRRVRQRTVRVVKPLRRALRHPGTAHVRSSLAGMWCEVSVNERMDVTDSGRSSVNVRWRQ